MLFHLSQLHSHQGQLHVKREYTQGILIHNAIPETVNGRGAPSVGKRTKIDSSSDPCPSDIVYVVRL